ncbi:hypothetical protein DM860_004504 [Cuscuta australis]|uniref:Uncharacterized protein n=1 Tax=Cuscuta australis TaxID=267555 RepID=A0A328EBS3_9ASTE|nr:hypothetical protein DM860_004504 [Cuscuta australis]
MMQFVPSSRCSKPITKTGRPAADSVQNTKTTVDEEQHGDKASDGNDRILRLWISTMICIREIEDEDRSCKSKGLFYATCLCRLLELVVEIQVTLWHNSTTCLCVYEQNEDEIYKAQPSAILLGNRYSDSCFSKSLTKEGSPYLFYRICLLG